MSTMLKSKLVYMYFKYIKMRNKNVYLSRNIVINRKCEFEGYNSILNKTEFVNSKIGFGSYIANNSIIKNTKIGRYCAIGDNVRTSLGIHPSRKFVSIHPSFFSINKQAGFTFVKEQLFEEHKYVDQDKKYVVRIENDVWIGNNVIIMDGVTIGDGAIIAAGSIVTKDVKPYSIIAGVPAKIIRYRFEEKYIKFLNELKWWDKEYNWILNNSHYFTDIKKLYKKYGFSIG